MSSGGTGRWAVGAGGDVGDESDIGASKTSTTSLVDNNGTVANESSDIVLGGDVEIGVPGGVVHCGGVNSLVHT